MLFQHYNILQEYDDGEIALRVNSLSFKGFKTEKEMAKFIRKRISNFCRKVLNDEFIELIEEKPALAIEDMQCFFGARGRRVDMVIVCKGKTYILELKNPSTLTENRHAIGQLLDYGREYLDSQKELILITTKFCINTARTIEHYKLPIRYIYLDRFRSLEFMRETP